jgi:hypothetical protein
MHTALYDWSPLLRLLFAGMAVAALLLGAFTHPYLLVMAAALLCAVPLQAAIARDWPGLRRAGLALKE